MDSLGEVDVLVDKLWGAQTRRSLVHDRAQKPKELDLSKPPLSIVVIISRLDSCVRSPIEPRETVLRVGSLELDLIDRTARRGGRPIDLRPREFQLLKYMMRRSDQVLTRTDLLRDVWHYKFVPETNFVDVHMGRLRCKVDGSNEAPHDSQSPRRRIPSQRDSSAREEFIWTAGTQAERAYSNKF